LAVTAEPLVDLLVRQNLVMGEPQEGLRVMQSLVWVGLAVDLLEEH
jgi:hypothetical protein